jgi:hypothetical protein
MTDASQDIDAVVLWVDGDDPVHRQKLDNHLASIGRRPHSAHPTRFRSVGEVDYCIRSILKFAPFVRRIHVVTDAQVPAIFETASAWPRHCDTSWRWSTTARSLRAMKTVCPRSTAWPSKACCTAYPAWPSSSSTSTTT